MGYGKGRGWVWRVGRMGKDEGTTVTSGVKRRAEGGSATGREPGVLHREPC